MIIAGAGGHAREILDMFDRKSINQIFFFDNVNRVLPESINGVKVLSSVESVKACLLEDARFIIGTGKPSVRKKLFEMFLDLGGSPYTCIASSAFISVYDTMIGEGCNIMHGAFISNTVSIGKGTLVNAMAHLHHDVVAGDFCEIGPSALLLGNVRIGHNVSVGAGAILLPGVEVQDGAVIGAGAVVTKLVVAGKMVKGIPAT